MPKIKKISLGLLLAVFLGVNLLGTFLLVQPARATPVEVLESIPDKLANAADLVWTGLKVGAYSAALNTIQYVTKKLAYDSAVWLASGGKGETPFAYTKSFGDYMASVGSGAFGTFVDELGKPLGLNLCKIPDLRLDLLFRLGLRKKYFPDTPACNWENFKKGWSPSTFQSMYLDKNALSQRFTAALKPSDSDMGLFITADEKIDNLVATQRWKAEKEREEGGGVKSLSDLISGNIQTPAEVMNQTARDYGNITEYNQGAQTEILNEAFSAGMEQLIPSTVSVFLNTLLGQMVENYFTKGMFPFGIGYEEEQQPQYDMLSAQYAATGVQFGGRRLAEKLFSGMLQTTIGKVEKYNVMGNLANCPPNPGVDNCAVDEGLVQAVQLSNGGQTVTIKDSLDQAYLNGGWKLLPPSRVEDNADPNCYTRAYCYRNIKLLRQARVLPLGFEIAAKNSNPDNPWTLKQVVDGFDDCKYALDGTGAKRYDANGNPIIIDDPSGHPFCRLIDPNWVIKAPPARCDALVYNELPTGQDVPTRQQSCADLKSCVGYNQDGSCYAYGYCTREQNTWRFNLDKCDAQYRTCRTFVDAGGNQLNYLYRTLNTGDCTADNAGCKAYSLESSSTAGVWAEPVLGANYYNPYIYFNSKVPQTCSAGSAGCSALKVAAVQDTSLYLRKAPYYLGCYASSNALSSIALDKIMEAASWPQTRADLARLTPSPECKKYSQVCIPEEVGCDIYKSVTYNNPDVPGKFKPAEVLENQIIWNDQCDAKCVGYAAYREMPSNYSSGQDISYIIPSSGSVCSAQEEGCSGFTNLSTATGGVENVEYYSYLRPCITPDAAKQKNFYTYEGSQEGGYQLKVYILVKDDATGAPKYWYRSSADLAVYDNICNEAKYKAGTADPDCRQFNDEAGQIYYKLLAKTIAVSGQCTPYRLNQTEMEPISTGQIGDINACTAQKGLWNNGHCELCYQNGEYKDGYCFYEGLPAGADNTAGISRSCGAQAESCRAFKGNAGNNVKNILSENFETVTSTPFGWTAGAFISTESTRQGGHSLGFNGAGPVAVDLVLTLGKSYDLNFWAKGSVQGLTVSVVPVSGPSFTPSPLALGATVTVGDAWRSYHLGPMELKPANPADVGATTSVRLSFTFSASGQAFLDNLRLVEVTDYIYLVKKTLKVDLICDSNPDDNLPGEALGCAQYQSSANQSFYLTNFSYLCRENAVGCTAFLDTFNTPDEPGPRLHNVWLIASGGSLAEATVGNDKYSCQVPVGKTGCYVNIIGHTMAEVKSAIGVTALVASTVYIPPDTPTNTPIYLVATKDATCNVADLGCAAAGARVFTPDGWKYQAVTVKNDPALYDNDLCTSEAEGCNAYTYKQGAYYFKDPVQLGQKICAYRAGVKMPDGVKRNGWFWKGVGKCECKSSTTNGRALCTSLQTFGSVPDNCQSDNDCGGLFTCAGINDQPCYPDYKIDDFNLGLWSYGVQNKYNNFVGECPAEQNGCTEYVDHNDNNRAYYFLDNENFKTAQANCNGQISQRYGCVLLDNTEQPTKLWNTTSSYFESTKKNFALIAPISDAGNDANIIAKVVRDRQCSEWLQCQASHRAWDQAEGKFKSVCDAVGRCNKLAGSADQGDISECVSWINGNHDYAGTILSDTLYRNRDISWGGHDYSGWSIPGLYPVEELEQINLGEANTTSSDWRLVKRIVCGGVNCPAGMGGDSTNCQDNNQFCGAGQTGLCLNHSCVQTPDGSNQSEKLIGASSFANTQRCRSYPEADSPFPNTTDLMGSQSFARVNKCNESFEATGELKNAYACDCNYKKVKYGDFTTKYWNLLSPNSLGTPKATSTGGMAPSGPLNGVCISSGEGVDGKYCVTDGDCGSGGICAKKTGITQLLGWQGYCLEEDSSRVINADQNRHPCLTWLPIEQLTGVPDLNNQYTDAGFEPSKISAQGNSEGLFYCVRSAKWEYRKTYTVKVSGLVDFSHLEPYNGTQIMQLFLDNPTYANNLNQLVETMVGQAVDAADGTAYGDGTGYWQLLPFPKYVCGSDYSAENLISWSSDHLGNGQSAEIVTNDSTRTVTLNLNDHSNDDIHMEYECVPKQSEGWYPVDDSEHENGSNLIPAGQYGEGRDFKIGRIAGQANGGTEVLKTICEAMYQTVQDNNAKAFTDKIFVKPSFSLRSPACLPVGALGLNITPDGKNILIEPSGTCGMFKDPSLPPPLEDNAKGGVVKSDSSDIYDYFAKIYKFWGLITGSGSPPPPVATLKYSDNYTSYQGHTFSPNTSDHSYNLGKDAPPMIFPVIVKDCRTIAGRVGEQCREGDTPGFTLNNINEGDVVIDTRPAKVTAKFFALADKDHMQLRRYMINWGDGTTIQASGEPSYYKNHRGARTGKCVDDGTGKNAKVCVVTAWPDSDTKVVTSTAACASDSDCFLTDLCATQANAPFWSYIKDKTCDSNYFYFEHPYPCQKGIGPNYKPDGCPDGWTDGCCVFQPKIQVLDNWDWCNGSCVTTTPGRGGCYDSPATNQCAVQDPRGWTTFGGQVIVKPTL